ncbi:hypothetical protein JKP88DRAFT_278600 [Tribonema minus]|uniref:Uncharacterized protein n=1 Tax=Tribonema minus TaxID=303371 RepID=A0A835YVS5_9STRA|nr:hypothetical protein JKP88DRAFT_278600 [Tribonema minus]
MLIATAIPGASYSAGVFSIPWTALAAITTNDTTAIDSFERLMFALNECVLEKQNVGTFTQTHDLGTSTAYLINGDGNQKAHAVLYRPCLLCINLYAKDDSATVKDTAAYLSSKYPRSVCVRSADKVSGTNDQYFVNLPLLDDGPWICECQGTFLSAAGISEHQIRGGSLSGCQSTNFASNWSTALTYVNNVPTMMNRLYFSSAPPLQIEVRHVVVSSGLVTTSIGPNAFLLRFVPYDPVQRN